MTIDKITTTAYQQQSKVMDHLTQSRILSFLSCSGLPDEYYSFILCLDYSFIHARRKLLIHYQARRKRESIGLPICGQQSLVRDGKKRRANELTFAKDICKDKVR